jgi:acyl carrier protein
MSCADPFEIVAEALRCKREDLNINSARYRTHGWDSFGHLAVILALEQASGILIDDASIEKYATMTAIVELFENQCYVEAQ